MPEVQTVWPNKIFKFLSILIIGQPQAGVLMLVYLPEIDSPLVALAPFWSLPYLLASFLTKHSLFAPGVMPKTTHWRCMQS